MIVCIAPIHLPDDQRLHHSRERHRVCGHGGVRVQHDRAWGHDVDRDQRVFWEPTGRHGVSIRRQGLSVFTTRCWTPPRVLSRAALLHLHFSFSCSASIVELTHLFRQMRETPGIYTIMLWPWCFFEFLNSCVPRHASSCAPSCSILHAHAS